MVTHPVRPTTCLAVREAAIATGVTHRDINRLIDENVLAANHVAKAGRKRTVAALALPLITFGASEGPKLSKATRLNAMALIERVAKANWQRLQAQPDYGKALHFTSGALRISLGFSLQTAMEGLGQLASIGRRIEQNPRIRGGAPVLKGTRITAYEVADSLMLDGLAITLEDFPALCEADLEAALLFNKAYPRSGRPKTRPQTTQGLMETVHVPR